MRSYVREVTCTSGLFCIPGDFVSSPSCVCGSPVTFARASRRRRRPKFVPSKWETVDPETVQLQAVTTSKWDLLDQGEEDPSQEDIDGE